MPIRRVPARQPVIVGQAAQARALDVRHRIERLQLLRNRIHPGSGDLIVLELDPAGPGGQVAAERIVNPLLRAVRVDRAAEVAIAHSRRRHAEEIEQVLAAAVSLVRPEEEQLIAADRSAQGPAERLPFDGQLRGDRAPPEVVGVGVQLLVVEELERRAFEVIRARLGDDRNRDAGCHPLFGIHAARRHVDRLDRLRRGDVDVVVRQPHVDVPRAVGERGVGGALLAVHRHVERTLRRVGLGIRQRRRHRARDEHLQRLVVSELIEREIGDLPGVQLGVGVGLVRLQELGGGLDGDHLGQGADRQREVRAADLANRDGHAGSHGFFEPLQGDPDVIRPGLDVRERVRALRVGGRLAREVGVRVDDLHAGPRDDRSLRVDHVADEAAIQELRLRRYGRGGNERQPDTHQTETRSR